MGDRAIEIRFNVIDTTKFDQFEPAFQEEMYDSMVVITNKVLGDAEARAPVDRNFYRGSMQPLISSPTTERPTMKGEVVATAPHARILEAVDEEGNEVEFGRRPGTKFPDVGELKLWVERVLSPPEKDLDEVTYAVGRAIVAKGLRPESRFNQPGRPIGDAFRANADFIDKVIQQGIDRSLNRI